MKIGDQEVITLAQMARRLGLNPATLRQQVLKGVLTATLMGHTYLVTVQEAERYRNEVMGKMGFANKNHPLHGKGGGRRKKDTQDDGTL